MRLTEQEKRAEDEGTMTLFSWALIVAGAVVIALAIWGIDVMVAAQWPSL